MEVEFERNLKNNYMVIKGGEGYKEDYQVRMLMRQGAKGLLPVEVRFLDGKPEFYYNISSKQKLSEWLRAKKLTYDMLLQIIKSLYSILETAVDFLLDCNHLILEAEYIFADIEKCELYLCYYPLYDREITYAGQEFLQYLLEVLDYNDKQAVESAYELFRLCMKDGFSTELLTGLWQNRFNAFKEKKALDTEKTEAGVWKSVVPVSVMDEEISEECEVPCFLELSIGLRKKLSSGLAAAEVLLIFCGIVFLKSFSWLAVIWILTILFIFAAVLGLTFFYDKIMQFTKIAEVKVPIHYENIDFEGGDRYENEKHREYNNGQEGLPGGEYDKVYESGEEAGYEAETVLLGYITEGGCRRLHYVGRDNEKDIVINKNPFTVGKSEYNADYTLAYPFVSRMHFRIEQTGEKYYITDTNSRNGVMLNGMPMKAMETKELIPGDRVEVGELKYVFQ